MDSDVRKCQTCARGMRPVGAAASAYPGTAIRHSRTVCRTCWRRQKTGFDPINPICTYCNRKIRPQRKLRSEVPGTVVGVISRRICLTCKKDPSILQKPKPVTAVKKSRFHKCQGCDRETRPWGSSKTAYPGTVARGSALLCTSCYQREQRGLPWWEMNARRIQVPDLTLAEKVAATRLIVRSGGDMLVLEALGLKDVYAQVR